MASTYSNNLPTAKDRMRHLLGDTDMENALRQDEEYLALLAGYPTETEATAVMAESLAAQFGQEPDSVSTDGTTVSWHDRVKTWLELATRLRTALKEIKVTSGSVGRVLKPHHYNDRPETSQYVRPPWTPWPDYNP
jgi:hypothetical protein